MSRNRIPRASTKRIEALERIHERIARKYREAHERPTGTRAYQANKTARLAGELGAIEWAIEQANRSK